MGIPRASIDPVTKADKILQVSLLACESRSNGYTPVSSYSPAFPSPAFRFANRFEQWLEFPADGKHLGFRTAYSDELASDFNGIPRLYLMDAGPTTRPPDPL